jgi:bla regulator protein BlaR1
VSGASGRSRIIGMVASVALHACLAVVVLWPSAGRRVSAPAARQSFARSLDPLPDVVTSTVQSADETRAARARAPRERLAALSVVRPNLAHSGPSDLRAWLNHLWQSTLFACAVGLLTLAFRRNGASVRYGLWFIASTKFLVPVSVLTALGTRLFWTSADVLDQAPAALLTLAHIGQPFLDDGSAVVPAFSTPGAPGWASNAILSIWACGCLAVVLLRCQMWRSIRRVVRTSAAADIACVVLPPRVQVREAPGLVGPGAVGFWRPIILIPSGIEEHLTPPQLEAVLTHELCHIKRRDNLTAAMHMLVEAVVWFHPLVWWIGARLVDERERACDEEVLRQCRQPRAYAEGILHVCRRYVEARLPCVSGAGRSDLERRIEAILRNQVGDALGVWRKLLLATAAIATVTAPIAVGAHGVPFLRAQSPARTGEGPAFEVASIKANRSRDARSALMPQPGGRLTATNVTVAELIRFAYDLPAFQVSGGPDWLGSDRFDVMAKAEGDPPSAHKRLMLRRLLAERFKLIVHTETRQLQLYALVMARTDRKMGPRLRRTEVDCTRTDQPSSESGVGLSPTNGPPRCGYFGFAPGTDFPSGRGGLAFRGLTMPALAKTLVPMVGRGVIDQTGLAGAYDGEFDFIAELPLPPPPPGVPSPFGSDPFASVFTVFPQQLGLKLDARRGPVEILVIDRAEHPTEN